LSKRDPGKPKPSGGADYKAAKRASEEAAAELREYDDLAMRIVALLAKLASADLAVQNVNANLPEGAEPIVRPEDIAFGALPRKVVEETEIVEWFEPNACYPLSLEDAARVIDLNDGTGRLRRLRSRAVTSLAGRLT
jgi:hypothetical protein